MSNPIPFVRAYIGLGSNLSSPQRQVTRAIAELAQLPESRLCAVSSLYRSLPMGPSDQPDYINAVAAIETRLQPLELLDALQEVENSHRRQRGAQRWGPRTLDLDLLLFGSQQIEVERLTVPHYGMHERSFVLCPLAEIAPTIEVSGKGALATLIAALNDGGCEALERLS